MSSLIQTPMSPIPRPPSTKTSHESPQMLRTKYVNALSRIRSLEASIEHLNKLHGQTLSELHAEIQKLQHDYSGLVLELANYKEEKHFDKNVIENKEWDELSYSMKQSLERLNSRAKNLEDGITVDYELIMNTIEKCMKNESIIEMNESVNEHSKELIQKVNEESKESNPIQELNEIQESKESIVIQEPKESNPIQNQSIQQISDTIQKDKFSHHTDSQTTLNESLDKDPSLLLSIKSKIESLHRSLTERGRVSTPFPLEKSNDFVTLETIQSQLDHLLSLVQPVVPFKLDIPMNHRQHKIEIKQPKKKLVSSLKSPWH